LRAYDLAKDNGSLWTYSVHVMRTAVFAREVKTVHIAEGGLGLGSER
jgi:hypothetical protein